VALTIAGSDSGGGAGVQADLKVFALHGVFGCSALSGLTAQNSLGVQAVHPVPARFLRAQLDSVLSDLPVSVVKTGMLWSRGAVRAVADRLEGHDLPLVVDPVMVAKGGTRLLRDDAVGELRRRLLPRALVVTPNLDEAGVLIGTTVASVAAMRAAARRLVELGASSALVKGGHLRGVARDVFWDGVELVEFAHRRYPTHHSHGTGCVLSAVITARLALGQPLRSAIAGAIDAVASILARAAPLGRGHGPADPLLVSWGFPAREARQSRHGPRARCREEPTPSPRR